MLLANIASNGYDIEAHRLALSDHPGELRFTTGMGAMNHVTVDGTEVVQATTLDRLIGERRVAGIKMDVEGSELLALAGAASALADHRIGVLQLETGVQISAEDYAIALAPYGYCLLTADAGGRLVPIGHLAPTDPDVFAMPLLC